MVCLVVDVNNLLDLRDMKVLVQSTHVHNRDKPMREMKAVSSLKVQRIKMNWKSLAWNLHQNIPLERFNMLLIRRTHAHSRFQKRLRVVEVPDERVIVNISLIPPEGRDPAEHVIGGLSDGCVPPGISPVLNHIHPGMHPAVLSFGIQIHQEGVTLAILVDWLSISNSGLNHA